MLTLSRRMPLQCDIRSPLRRGLVGHLGCTQCADETGDCKWEGVDGRLVEWVNCFRPPTFLMPALTSLSGFPSHKIPLYWSLCRGERVTRNSQKIYRLQFHQLPSHFKMFAGFKGFEHRPKHSILSKQKIQILV